jgi:signal peptidase II
MSLIIPAIALGVAGADQFTKWLVHDRYLLPERVRYEVIDSFLTVCHAHNRGAIGGILSENNWLLIGLSVAALFFLIVFRRSFVTAHREHLFALGLIAGGIIGNLTDRLARGHVEDFLILHFGDFPLTYVFNIADAAICSGVVIYIIALLLPRKKAETGQASGAAETEKAQSK